MDWNVDAIERLRALWSEGHSTAEIGRRMGISKNAVVGKAHRLQLPARPSPIRREALTPRPAPAGRRPTLPPLRMPVSTSVPVAPAPNLPVAAKTPLVAKPAPATLLRPFPRASARSCCWPIGEPGTEGFRFCSAEAMPSKPYCLEHASVAYVRVKDRREDAA
ncbi:MAG: GcrA family cell cycle regulator [Acetobacteraceae bacterium]|nr:GcrA family cell cycle regulator [Acetobacteraceae bacterium]